MSIKSARYLEYKEFFEQNMLDYLPETSDVSDKLLDAMSYSLTAGGKRLRPVLLLAACELCGGNRDFALPFAAAAEFIQTYSLIHDDLPGMDNDDLRRGMPTNHKVFGEGFAILAGDGLLSQAHEIMEKEMLLSLDSPEDLHKKVIASYVISEGTGCSGMVAGQAADLFSENNKSVFNENTLEYIHKHKTASFIKACIMAGAYLGDADKLQLERLESFADNFGMAFQIVDDIQDVVGSREERGKNTGGDAASGKLTYPLIFGLKKSKALAEQYIQKALESVVSFGTSAEVFASLCLYLKENIII